MDYVKIESIPKILYDEVIKLLSPSHHLELKDATTGKQPNNTVIIGLIKKEAKVQKLTNFKGSQRKRFYLTEITADKTEGEKFQIIVIGNYAIKLEAAMENLNCDIWLTIINCDICNYNGYEKDVQNLSLRVEETLLKKQPELIIIYEVPIQSRKTADKLLEYTPLNDICQNQKYNFFVLVQEVIKKTVVLLNGNKHTMLALIDPSCMKPDAVRNDLPVNIFFNNPNENFKEVIEEGDILRIRDMLVEFFAKENKLYGKIFNSNSITHFKNSELNNEVTPITKYSSYVLSDQDREKVLELRDWWKSLNDNDKHVNKLCNMEKKDDKKVRDSFQDERTIRDVTEPSKFILFCQVTEIRPISTYDKLVILRVTDGTTSKVAVNRVSMHEATQDLLSPNNRAIRNTKEIDVAIFDQVDLTAGIKVNDFLRLENVKAVDLNDDHSNKDFLEPILDFYMEKENSKITILPQTHARVRQIKSRLKDKNAAVEINSDDDSMIQLARTLQNLENNFDLKRKSDCNAKEDISSSPLKKKSCRIDLSHTQGPTVDDMHSENVTSPSYSNNKDVTSVLHCIKDVNKSQPLKSCLTSNIQHSTSTSISDAVLINSAHNDETNNYNLIRREDSNKSSSDLPLEDASTSTPLNLLNASVLSNDLSVKGNKNSHIKKADPVLKKNTVGEKFIITNHPTDNLISTLTNNEIIGSSDEFDVTSTPAKSPLNRTPLYDGLSMELTMIDRAPSCSPVDSIPVQKAKKAFQFKSIKNIPTKTIYSFGKQHFLDIELTDSTANLRSLSQMVHSCKMGDTWQSYVILKEILTETEEICSECVDNDDVLCFHDIIWGVCTKGVHRIQPSELRKCYSKEDLRNCEVLYCKDCPTNTDNNNLEFPIEPFFKFVLKVQDISNEEIVSVYLEGDHAETFFDMKPSFFWTVAQCDIRLIYKFFTLEQRRDFPLKLGFCCYENDARKSIQVFGTKIVNH